MHICINVYECYVQLRMRVEVYVHKCIRIYESLGINFYERCILHGCVSVCATYNHCMLRARGNVYAMYICV